MTLSSVDLQSQNRTEVPTQATTNTLWGNVIMKCLATRQHFELPQYTTLNEKYGILAEESIGRKFGGDFELKYFGIGVRGWKCDGTNVLGGSKSKLLQHQPIDMDMFSPIPFIGRPLSQDLDPFVRQNYRMRTIKDIGDVEPWVFYWIKLTNFDNYGPGVYKITRDEDGNESPVTYVPERDNLFSPQPRDFNSEGSVPIPDVYLNSSGLYDCSLHGQDLVECVNACRALYNDASLASISESTMIWGYDTKTDGQIGNGAVVRYDEIVSAVVGHHVTEKDGRQANNNTDINMVFDHGASEPMLLHTDATAPVTGSGN